jgi:glycosyltransferase involved in cell wall biosynthesis
MNILVFSINPIFPDLITGGASKHLFHVVRSLGQAGHQVQILCAQAKHPQPDFFWTENVHVSQNLPFHMPFPQPYAISGADLGLIVERIAKKLATSDRFYIHDGEFLVPDVYAHIPTVTSFRDNIYPESVLGTFVGKADDVICVSGYSAAVVMHTAARFFKGLQDRIHQVSNGIDFDMYKPVDSTLLAQQLGINPQVDAVLLHPHRPEPGKGLPETIKVVEQLVHRHGRSHIKVLVPEWIDTMIAAEDSAFYQQMNYLIDELGVREHFIFIPWMPQEQMPALYSLGQVTLSLGNFVESFGNVAYESLACGTPSVIARVGPHRTILPDELIDKVNYGDIEAAVVRVLDILNGKRGVHSEVLDYLQSTMDIHHQVSTYSEIIIGCEKRKALTFSAPQYHEDQPYALAPWCYVDGERIYHDFHMNYEQDEVLTRLLRESSMVSRVETAADGITEAHWERWLSRTWLVPVESEHR